MCLCNRNQLIAHVLHAQHAKKSRMQCVCVLDAHMYRIIRGNHHSQLPEAMTLRAEPRRRRCNLEGLGHIYKRHGLGMHLKPSSNRKHHQEAREKERSNEDIQFQFSNENDYVSCRLCSLGASKGCLALSQGFPEKQHPIAYNLALVLIL